MISYKNMKKNGFGFRLKELMNDYNINVSSVAEKIGMKDDSIIYQWLNGSYLPSLKYANAIANIFNCSLDYLFGFTDDFKNVKNQNLKNFSHQLETVIEDNKVSKYELINKAGICKSSLRGYFKEGKLPTMNSVIKLANYLNVSIDYLVGRD